MQPMPFDPRRIEVIDDQMAAVWRAKTGAERLQVVDELFQFARQLVASGVRAQHPDWDPAQVERETVRRLSRGAF